MAADIQRTRVRFAVDAITSRGAAITDTLTGLPVALWQAEDVQVEVGIFKSGTIAADITNFASVTLEVKDPDNLLGSPLIQQTVLAASLDQSVSLAHWNDGSEQHALFVFTYLETNVELGGRKVRDLALFVWATTMDATARRLPLGSTTVRLMDSGYGDLGAITILPPGARMKTSKLQVLNQDDSLYYNLVARNVGGVPTLSVEGAGEA